MDSIEKVIKDSTEVRDDCWVWQGPVGEDGYGILECGGRDFPAHRSSAIVYGSRVVLPYMTVYQTCGNKLCCNPEHLRIRDGRADYDCMGRENIYKSWVRGIPKK